VVNLLLQVSTFLLLFTHTFSGRKINWVGLPLLPENDVQALLVDPEWSRQATFRHLVRLSSGYPRIVEALKAGYPDLIRKNPGSLQDALPVIRQVLTGRNLELAVTLDDLRLALLAKEVYIDMTLPSGATCGARVANGAFIRPTRDGAEPEDKTDVPFIPLVPLLPLFLWAYEQQDNFPARILYEFMKQCFDCTLEDSQLRFAHRAFYGAGFEHAHAYYLALRALLEKSADNVYLLTPTKRVSTMKQLTNPALKVIDEFSGLSKTLTLFLNQNLSDPKNIIILQLGGKFPGCDLLLFRNEQGKIHLSLYQPKYIRIWHHLRETGLQRNLKGG
jgi:hypothetical protein